MKISYHKLFGDKQYTYIVRSANEGKEWKVMKKKKADYGKRGTREWKDVRGLECQETLEKAERVLETYAREKGLKRII